jgi:3-methyladenine DNA glycosylase/8-oxoguanine DNA glycosylase
VDFRRLLSSHGVATLPPNRPDPAGGRFQTAVEVAGTGHGVTVAPGSAGAVTVSAPGRAGRRTSDALVAVTRRVLSLDEDLSGFYERAAQDPALAWVTTGAGRMLRSPTVFEDVVKTICTTNCTWSATIRMTTAIVDGLGAPASGGLRAFPGPAALADAPDGFFEAQARAGYRGAYLRTLATGVADGSTDLESLADPDVPDDEVERRLLALPGVGPYAAAHIMLTSLGRYRRLILDSWTRPTYAALVGKPMADDAIVRRFRRFGPYAGLAFWLRLTRDWVEEPA